MAIESIDAQLGGAEHRFFGAGYTRVTHSFIIEQADDSGADYSATVTYPTDWSTKHDSHRPPHLSSVDAMALAVSITEEYLGGAYSEQPQHTNGFWIRSCALLPGPRPITELDKLHVRLDVNPPSNPGLDWDFSCAIETFIVKLRIAEGRGNTLKLANSTTTYFGGRFRNYQRRLGTVRRDDGRFSASAQVSPPSSAPLPVDAGIEAYYDAVTMLDAVIFCAQVGQVALYEIDDLQRAQSDELWLRSAEFTRAAPPRSGAGGASCTVQVLRTQLIERARLRWRTADLVGTVGDITVSFRLAHALPHLPGQTE